MPVTEAERLKTRREVLDQVRAKTKLNERQKNEFLQYYQPHPGGQAECFNSHAEERWLLGGNDSGKTTDGVVETALACLGCHPTKSYITHPIGAWAVSVDFPNSRDVVQDKFFKYVPGRYISGYDKESQTVRFTTDSTLSFKSCDSGSDKFQGGRKDWIWFDEEPSKAVYKECKARIPAEEERELEILGTMTPLKGLNWHYYDIYLRSQQDPKSGIAVFFCDTTENVHLSQKKQDKLKNAYVDEADIVSRIHGRYTSRAGLVLAKFLKDGLNMIDPFEIKLDWPRVLAIDPHPKNPSGVLFGAVRPDNRIVFFDEIYDVLDVDQLGLAINKRKNHYGGTWARSLIDSSAVVKEQTSGKSVKDILAHDYFIHTTLPIKKDKLNGIVKMQRALVPLPGETLPRVLIFKTCQKLLWEMSIYAWQEWKGAAADQHDQREEVVKKADHLLDGYRYIIQSNPVYFAPGKTVDRREGRNATTGY